MKSFKFLKIIACLLYTINWAHADDSLFINVTAGDNQGLIDAIITANNSTQKVRISVLPDDNGNYKFTFSEAYMGTENALPIITNDVTISPGFRNQTLRFERDPNSDSFRFLEINGNSDVDIQHANISTFNINGNGGAIKVSGEAIFRIHDVKFRNNFATGQGGAIFSEGNSSIYTFSFIPNLFQNNRSSSLGGAISVTGNSRGLLHNNIFENNSASVFGCDINVNSTFKAFIVENIFTGNCENVLIENPSGAIKIKNNTFNGIGNAIDSTSSISMIANIFNLSAPPNNSSKNLNNKAICNDFGTNAFNSLGHNISNEDSCNLDQSTDLINTDPKLNTADANGVISLKSDSPAIDAGPINLLENEDGFDALPCGFKDSRGLGRPQDANGDGVYECDIGSYEVQAGADLNNAQSGLYYDSGRSGEGVIVEMLSTDSALVTMFTYHPNKTDLMWFISVGQVVGNTLVFEEVLRTSGGVFGEAFNPDNVVNTDIGGMSLIFPDCESQANSGRLVFEADFDFADELENLLVRNTRLSRLINCDQSQPNLQTGRSGSFYDPSRSGEGVFVQVLENGSSVVIFYSYTPDGKQFWFISSDVQITGNTITATMIYPASTTGFGSQFNASELDFQTWGTLTLEYQPGCNSMNMSYNSSVPGFGNGNHTYQRLTQPAGTTCDL
jgi:predicted outer membrane repeat protein